MRSLAIACPVLDHMWQTETGGPIVANPYGLGLLPIKPGSGGIALPGIEASVITPEGVAVRSQREGHRCPDSPVS